jgi:hypothetical protein
MIFTSYVSIINPELLLNGLGLKLKEDKTVIIGQLHFVWKDL